MFVNGKVTINGGLSIKGGLSIESGIASTVERQTSLNSESEVIDSFVTSDLRSAKYQIQVSQGLEHQVLELLVIHNDFEVSFLEYGNISTGREALTTTEVSLSNGTIRVIMKRRNQGASAQVRYTRVVLKSPIVAPSMINSGEMID